MTGGFCNSRRKLLVLLAGGSAALLGCEIEPSPIAPVSGAVFPELSSLESLEEPVAAKLENQALVVNFWASWCGPCRTEMPALQKLDELLSQSGIRVVAVSIDKDRNLAREFIRSVGVSFPVYFDPAGVYSTGKLGLRTLPETFLVDASGIIRDRISGARDWASPASVRLVTEQIQVRRSGDVAYRGGLSPN